MSTILPHMVWPLCEFRMQVWNMLYAARCKYRTQKSRQKSPSEHHRTTLSGYIFATKARIDNRKKNLLSSNNSSTCPHNMVNFGPLAAEIVSLVWGTQLISTGFASWQRYCTATLRRWTDGATCIRQGGHHVGHWPTFLVDKESTKNIITVRPSNIFSGPQYSITWVCKWISRQSVHLSPCRPEVGSRTNAIQAGDDDDHDGVIALVGGQEPSTDPTESQGQFSEMMSFSLMRCAVIAYINGVDR